MLISPQSSGQMTDQLHRKGGQAFKAIGRRLVLKSNSDIAFAEGAERMLRDKQLKSMKQKVDTIEVEWSNAPKNVMRSVLSKTAPEADLLAKEQSNKFV